MDLKELPIWLLKDDRVRHVESAQIEYLEILTAYGLLRANLR